MFGKKNKECEQEIMVMKVGCGVGARQVMKYMNSVYQLCELSYRNGYIVTKVIFNLNSVCIEYVDMDNIIVFSDPDDGYPCGRTLTVTYEDLEEKFM